MIEEFQQFVTELVSAQAQLTGRGGFLKYHNYSPTSQPPRTFHPQRAYNRCKLFAATNKQRYICSAACLRRRGGSWQLVSRKKKKKPEHPPLRPDDPPMTVWETHDPLPEINISSSFQQLKVKVNCLLCRDANDVFFFICILHTKLSILHMIKK